MSHFYYKIIHSDVKRCEHKGKVKATFGLLWMDYHIVFQELREYCGPRWSVLLKNDIEHFQR